MQKAKGSLQELGITARDGGGQRWPWDPQEQAGSGDAQLLQEWEQLPASKVRCCPRCCQYSAIKKGNNSFHIYLNGSKLQEEDSAWLAVAGLCP